MKTRVISAVLMILLFVPILILGNIPFAILMAVLGLLGLKELMDLEKDIPNWLKWVSYFICLFLILYNYQSKEFIQVVDYKIFGLLFFLYTISFVITGNLKKYNYKDSLWLLLMTFVVGILFSNFIHLRNINVYLVVYIFLISTITDTFALLCGRKFGKTKLAKEISPNKTVEGSIGGTIFGTIISVLFYLFFIDKSVNILLIVIVSMVLTIIGQIGDLFFSSIKRHYGVKDFSNLIPGHGGILDRLDSVLFVTFGYLLLTLIIG